jgi:hypothetical protein
MAPTTKSHERVGASAGQQKSVIGSWAHYSKRFVEFTKFYQDVAAEHPFCRSLSGVGAHVSRSANQRRKRLCSTKNDWQKFAVVGA